MDTLPYFCRIYKILEKQCIDLFSIVVIDDQCLDQPNATYSDLIYTIVPTIESLAKALHKELAQTDLAKSRVDPELQEFNAKEHFDYQALAFLDQALGLSTKQVKINSELVALSEESGNRILTPLLNAHKSEHAAEAAEAEAAARTAAKAAEKAKAKAEEAAAKAKASAEAATKASDATEATTKAEAKAEAAAKAKEAKSAANAAANAATKAATKATKAAEAAEAATKAEGANQPCHRPLWIKAYQDYKHDQANARQNSANCPTAKALLEAIGAAFLLLAVARALPLDKERPLTEFDFTFGSELFTATYTHASFNRSSIFKDPTDPLSPDDITLTKKLNQDLFVVKAQATYLQHLHTENLEFFKTFISAALSNQKFAAFFKSHKEDSSNSSIFDILSQYGTECGKNHDFEELAWSLTFHSIFFSEYFKYSMKRLTTSNEELRRLGFEPLVALNYKDINELYDYLGPLLLD